MRSSLESLQVNLICLTPTLRLAASFPLPSANHAHSLPTSSSKYAWGCQSPVPWNRTPPSARKKDPKVLVLTRRSHDPRSRFDLQSFSRFSADPCGSFITTSFFLNLFGAKETTFPAMDPALPRVWRVHVQFVKLSQARGRTN